MSNTDGGLPDFESPPVVEVVLGIQFEALPKLRSFQLANLWQRFKDRFPQVRELPPLDPATEDFGPPRPFKLNARFELLESPILPRFWFLNLDGTELIQIQQDRFIHNWRKTSDDDQYPHYRHIVGTFERELAEFRNFLAGEEIGELTTNQCEVTYINNIVAGDGWERWGQLDEIVAVWSAQYSDPFLAEPESVSLTTRHLIPGPSSDPIGRLTVTIDPAIRNADQRETYRMTLTARGNPSGTENADIRRFLDLGHEWIVRGFTSITTPKMHQRWGRFQ